MKNELSDPAFAPFLMQKLQERLSGSSVMSIDQAENIQRSIEFVLAHGEERSLPLRFEQGKEHLSKKLKELERLYSSIKEIYKSFGIESLDESISEIGQFFSNYDLDYGAAEVDQAFLDYQLAESVPLNYVGIDFYERYLENLAAEVCFVNNLPEDQIQELLAHYQQKLGFDYRKDVNNLFEIVFKQMIGKLLAEKAENTSLLLNPVEAQYAVKRLQIEFDFPQLNLLFEMNDYYRRVFQQLQKRASLLKEPESAFHFFITAIPNKKFLKLPAPMTETNFNQFLEAYSVADQEGKIELVQSKISAPEDFEEYLTICCESEEFYKEIFKRLNKNFLVTLIIWEKENYNCTLSSNNVDATTISAVSRFLKDYLKTLNENQKAEFFSIANQFQISSLDFS